MITIFILLQSVLFLFMVLHDWIPCPPFNDIEALKRSDSDFYRFIGSFINGMIVLVPLTITIIYRDQLTISSTAIQYILPFYLLLSIGTVLSWWVPYYFGSSMAHKQAFYKFKNTHRFLPARRDNVIPNTLHVVLHMQIWSCLAISLYFLFNA